MEPERTFAIGDIHGCDLALEKLLERIDPGANDRIILLGDLCDRGPNTSRVMDILLDLNDRCRLQFIMGNHDEMMLGVFGLLPDGDLNFWWRVGGSETIESYGGDPDVVPEAHLDFLAAGEPYVETATDIFVHAMLNPRLSLAEQSHRTLRWDKVSGSEQAHPDGRRIVCGHTAQRSGWPLVWPGWLCIDTCAYDPDGWLTAMETNTDEFYQANQHGDVRGPIRLEEIPY